MNDRTATQLPEKSFDAAVKNYKRRVGGKIQAFMRSRIVDSDYRGKSLTAATTAWANSSAFWANTSSTVTSISMSKSPLTGRAE